MKNEELDKLEKKMFELWTKQLEIDKKFYQMKKQKDEKELRILIIFSIVFYCVLTLLI